VSTADDDVPATGNTLGKRYRCATCETEILCVRPGSGTFACHGAPMEIIQLTALPSSD
jgi:hypothetical protein